MNSPNQNHPSPFYLQALPSPLSSGGQQPNSAYALLNAFFSPQRTPPTGLDGSSDENGGATLGKNGSGSQRLPSALRQGSSAGTTGEGSAGVATSKQASGSRSQVTSPTSTTPTGTRLTNRRFSSGTPLASPGRPQTPSRRSSKDLLFDYGNIPMVKVKGEEDGARTSESEQLSRHTGNIAEEEDTAAVSCSSAARTTTPSRAAAAEAQ